MYYVIKRVLYSGGDTYVVIKTGKRQPSILKGFKATTYYTKYTAINLNELVKRGCVDREFEQYINRFLSEGEFRELITHYINKCFKSEDAVAAKLKKLEDYIKSPVKGRQRKRSKYPKEYPVVVGYRSELRALFRNATAKYEYEFGRLALYLFKRSFCVCQAGDFAVFLPYDVERISVDAVAMLIEEVVDALKTVAREIERSSDVGALKDALNVIKYVVTLSEMLG